MNTELLTAKDVARLLQASEGHVRKLITRGAIPRPIRPGGRAVRWTPATISRWIENGCPAYVEREGGR